MAHVALKIVETPPAYQENVSIWSAEDIRTVHSLHHALPSPDLIHPDLVASFIDKFSTPGDTVLDPFCGFGTVALESLFRGRIAFASDSSTLSLRCTQAKIFPADIAQVTLDLQLLGLQRPVNTDLYSEYFSPFYDVRTFCELLNLKVALQDKTDNISRFIQMVALGLLHGGSSGHFSTYSFPQVALSPAEQEALNAKRMQVPEYRSTIPRILKKTASILRDGIPSNIHKFSRSSKCAVSDARDLSYLESDSVDLVVTAPPLPGSSATTTKEDWLRMWFCGLSSKSELPAFTGESLEEWLEFMNEVLFEMARVVKSGGRAVFDLRKLSLHNQEYLAEEELVYMLEESLSRYWCHEGTIINSQKHERLKNSLKPRQGSSRGLQNRVLILRRR